MAAVCAATDFSVAPELLYSLVSEFAQQAEVPGGTSSAAAKANNFLKAVRWSPDGCSLLSSSDDNCLRVYDVPPDALARCSVSCVDAVLQEREAGGGEAALEDAFLPALRVSPGESVLDACWFPGARAAEPASFVFASTARAHPLQLWDGVTGRLRASYRAYNAADEVTAATSCAFSSDGQQLCGGYDRAVRLFALERPGRDCALLPARELGLVTCLAASPSGLLAAGGTSRVCALLDSRSRDFAALLHGHAGGLTHARFSPCGAYLYTGARRDGGILCWDVRATEGGALFRLPRGAADTNQRLAFDIEPGGRHLLAGGTDGLVRAFDLRCGEEVGAWRAAAPGTCVSGVQLHPYARMGGTCSGQRRFDDEDGEDAGGVAPDNALSVWRWPAATLAAEGGV